MKSFGWLKSGLNDLDERIEAKGFFVVIYGHENISINRKD